MQSIFTRCKWNPILAPNTLEFPAAGVLNPAAAEQDGQVTLLLRVEEPTGHSNIHVATSKDGITGWDIDPEPILGYGLPEYRYERWGCEDARLTYLESEKLWYITYTAYSEIGAAVAIAKTKDLRTAERVALIFSPSNKDAVLFPAKFQDRFAVLHRPDAGGMEHIWSAYSPDLIHWGEPHCVIPEGAGAAWDGLKVGAGPPPLLTKHGWLLIYHGVKGYGGRLIYRVGLAMLDRDNPHKVIARAPGFVFQSQAPYELSGLVPNVVFPTGLLLRGDELWMYYGAADTYVCLATAKLQDVLNALE